MGETDGVAAAWDAEYHAGRYGGEPPVAFIEDILAAARASRLTCGLYVGCGNGRNYLPLVAGGLDLTGLDISATAIAQLAVRAPGRRPALVCGDLTALPAAATYPLVIGIQVFQHGDRARTHAHIRAAQARVAGGGLFCLRVNATGTDIWPEHEVTERHPDGGLTIRYLAGPKRRLLIHFFSAAELEALFGSGFEPVVPLRPEHTWRAPPKPGQWTQWEAIWRAVPRASGANGSSTPISGGGPAPGSARIGGMTSEPRQRAIGSLRAVALDAPDIDLLATFYEQFAGWRRVPDDDDEWITIDSGDGWRIGLQRATDHVPPHWPDQDRPQQAHLDFRVPDIDAAAERAQQLGASLLRRNERWHTLSDPAGHPFDLCVNPDDPRTTLMGLMLDCPDAKALSHFYAELLGKPVTYEADGVAMIGEDGAQPVMFQQVEQYTAPRWPDPAHPQQIHLDVTVQDVDAAERAALDIGATRLDGAGPNWRVYADPAGKPFCLVWTVSVNGSATCD